MPPKKKKTKPSPADDGEDGPEFSIVERSDGSSSDSNSSVDSQMVGSIVGSTYAVM